MQNIHSHLQTIHKTSNDSLLDTLIPKEVLGIVFDQVVNQSQSLNDTFSILLTCKKWKSVLQKNPCISLVQALFQLKGSHQRPNTIKHLQECLTTDGQKKSFTSQEFKLIDQVYFKENFKKLLMVDSRLFHPKSLFLSLLDHYSWDFDVCKKSANKNIQLVAEEQLSILNSLILGTDEQKLTVIENDSITKLYRGGSRSATWRQAKTSVISTLKKFPNFNDKKFFIQVAHCFGDAVFDIHESLKKDREIVLAAVQQNGEALELVDESFKKDREIVLAAVQQNGGAFKYADESLKKDREIVGAAVQQEGLSLKYADKSFQKDREIVWAAIQQRGWALDYADKSLKKDREIVLAAVKQNFLAFLYADASFKKDREIVLAAIKQDGDMLYWAAKSLKKDRDIVLAAVKQKGLALQYADESLTNDREIVLAAIQQDSKALEYASLDFRIERALTLLLQTSKNYILDLALHSVWHL